MGDMQQKKKAEHSYRKVDERPFLQKWLPHPLLTLVLILLWMALLNSFTAGVLFLGTILGVLIPIYTGNFWPERPIIRSPLLAIGFLGILIFDIVLANIQVAYLILWRRPSDLRTRWMVVPLDLTTPEAITVLTATITLTPGTVSSDLSADGKSLLVHALDLGDEAAMVRHIKKRYECRIKAIFP